MTTQLILGKFINDGEKRVYPGTKGPYTVVLRDTINGEVFDTYHCYQHDLLGPSSLDEMKELYDTQTVGSDTAWGESRDIDHIEIVESVQLEN